MQFDWSAIWPAIPILLEGAKMTLWISVLGLIGGLIIGLVAGFARTYGGWIANHVALVFIEVIRGTPIVVQVMFIYFALPMAFSDFRIESFHRRRGHHHDQLGRLHCGNYPWRSVVESTAVSVRPGWRWVYHAARPSAM